VARHIYLAPLRWGDQDAYAHINNVMYLRYLEEVRIDMLFERDHPAGLGATHGLVVSRNEIDYRKVLDYRPEPIRIEAWVSDIRAASFTLDYEFVDVAGDERVLYARARSVMVPVDLRENRPLRIRPDQRAVLEGFRDDREPGPAT